MILLQSFLFTGLNLLLRFMQQSPITPPELEVQEAPWYFALTLRAFEKVFSPRMC